MRSTIINSHYGGRVSTNNMLSVGTLCRHLSYPSHLGELIMIRFSNRIALAALASCTISVAAGAATYSETFDTDVADLATFTATYPDVTASGANIAVVGGVITAGANAEPEFVVTSVDAGFGADFGSVYTVAGDIGGLDGLALNYSPTLMISSNLGIEFGISSGGNEFFRIIARDFPTNTASVGGIPVQVADIGFDIFRGDLYRVTADIVRNGDGTVDLGVSVADANSSAVYIMPSQTFSAADSAALFVDYSQVGFRKRGSGDDGKLLADNLTVIPEPGSLALLGLGGLLLARRRHSH